MPDASSFRAHLKSFGDGQLLKDHLINVSAITSQLAGKIGMPHAGALIGLAHDLGKYSTAFQEYISRVAGDPAMEMEPDFSLRGSIDHSTAGAQIIATGLDRKNQESARFVSEALALCVASHHSGLIDCIRPDGVDGLTRRLNKDEVLTRLSEVWTSVEPAVRGQLESLLNNPEVAAEISTAIDQIRAQDSDEVIQPFKQGLLLRVLFSCLIDGDRTDTADFDKPRSASLRQHGEYVAWQDLIDRLERKLATFQNERWVDQCRSEISRHCLRGAEQPKGIFTLTVPTGGARRWQASASRCTMRGAGAWIV
jgi:CRISPR-associated endonuclease/helicase Cas3